MLYSFLSMANSGASKTKDYTLGKEAMECPKTGTMIQGANWERPAPKRKKRLMGNVGKKAQRTGIESRGVQSKIGYP